MTSDIDALRTALRSPKPRDPVALMVSLSNHEGAWHHALLSTHSKPWFDRSTNSQLSMWVLGAPGIQFTSR
jgi:hypothetical protein